MRCVKPSNATVSPSRRFAATASLRLWNLAMTTLSDWDTEIGSTRSDLDVEEHGFLLTLKMDVEGVGRQALLLAACGDQGRHARLVGNSGQNGTFGVGRLLVAEIHA